MRGPACYCNAVILYWFLALPVALRMFSVLNECIKMSSCVYSAYDALFASIGTFQAVFSMLHHGMLMRELRVRFLLCVCGPYYVVRLYIKNKGYVFHRGWSSGIRDMIRFRHTLLLPY